MRAVFPRLALSLLTVLAAAPPSLAQDIGDARAGELYATEVCAECHSVKGQGGPSPAPNAPTFVEVANRPGITGFALAAWLRTPHKDMPNLIIPQEEFRNVIAYILSLKGQSP